MVFATGRATYEICTNLINDPSGTQSKWGDFTYMHQGTNFAGAFSD
jgi:hypothetical protein